MMDLVRDVDRYARSRHAKGAWVEAGRKQPNGRRTAWCWGDLKIKEARNGAGLLTFKVSFPNGKHSFQSTLAEAMDYAEAHCAANS